MRTIDAGVNWSVIATGVTEDLYGIAANGATLMAVGDSGAVIMSTDSGATWTIKLLVGSPDLKAVVYASSKWVMVGDSGSILDTVTGATFDTRTPPEVSDFIGLAYSGAILMAVGSDGATITSADGVTWVKQEVETSPPSWRGLEYIDSRFIALGTSTSIGYSVSGTARPAFEEFQPISDLYRAAAFAQFGAYMFYVNMMEYDALTKEWMHYPRRVRSAAPGSVNDFTGDGNWFADFPGKGTLLDCVSINGGIVIAESDQLSLVTDGGSVASPWMYHQKYGEGLTMVSNLASLNGLAYGVATDGLIYRATVSQVSRLGGFFDLSEFDDWNPGSEQVWLDFDPMTQKLYVFRPASPWTLHLVDDETGGVTEFDIPPVTISAVDYEPRSAYTVEGEVSGIHVGYAAVSGGVSSLVTVKLDLSGPITSLDKPATGRFYGRIETGSFRLTALGVRGDLNEVLVRTWADPSSTVRPDIIVRTREASSDSWKSPEDAVGTIAVGAADCVGTKTAWSRFIAIGDDVTTDFTLPWLVDQCDVFIDTAGVKVAATFTKTGTYTVQLSAALATGEKLYVNPGATRPFVPKGIGDYIETNEGFHRITAVNTAYSLVLDWYPSAPTSGIYVPAQAIPAGGSRGDGHLVFGLGRGFDQVMLEILMLPHSACDAVGAKITDLELGYKSTGREMKSDEGG